MGTAVRNVTVRDVRLGDIAVIAIRPAGENDVEMTVTYDVKDNATGDIVERDSYTLTLSDATKTALKNFLNANVISAINTKENIPQ